MQATIQQEKDFQYIEEGKGPVLLLLHGLFGALSNWETVLEHFSLRYRVIIPLLPIYSLPLKQSNLEGLVAYLREFISHKQLDKFVLIGNSLGGHIAMIYTLQYPHQVSNLVLTASSGLYENAMGGSFIKRNNYDYIEERVRYTFYDPHVISKAYVDEVFNLVQDNQKVIRILAMAKSAQRHNLADRLGEIQAPTLLIWGLNDAITPPAVAHEFNALIPHSQLRFMDRCGHAPMMEHPLLFNEMLEQFLDEVVKMAP
jgi:pimeloyl-ACP methyl ester carboxylesterase